MDDKEYYPFYDFVSQVKYKPYSTANRYLKDQAKKPKHKHGNHPDLNSPRYEKEMKRRKCWQIPKDEKEKQERRADTQKCCQIKERKLKESKIRDAFCGLKYVSPIGARQTPYYRCTD
jgi:hypothetical protein